MLLAENSSQVKRLPTEKDTLLKSVQNFLQLSRLLKGKQRLHATDFHNEEDKFRSTNWACRWTLMKWMRRTQQNPIPP